MIDFTVPPCKAGNPCYAGSIVWDYWWNVTFILASSLCFQDWSTTRKMFVTVWKICLFLVFFNVFAVWQSPVQYEASWQGLSVVWVFLLLVHSSELQPVGCVGGWECHLWVCDKWKGHFCQALQHRPGNGSWDSGKSGFQRTKRWADRPVNPLVRCATFSPFQCFFPSRTQTAVCTRVPSQRQPSSAPTVSLASPRHVGTAPGPALHPGGEWGV